MEKKLLSMYNTQFMTLQSNASLKLHPNNKASHFIVQLPNYVQFDQNTKVGLAEIHTSLKFTRPTNPVVLTETAPVQSDSTLSISNVANNDDDNGSPQKRSKRKMPPHADTTDAIQISANIRTENGKSAKDINYEATIIELRNNFLASYEHLRRSLDNCRSSLRQSELLQECGNIIVSKFNESIENLKSEENVLSIYLASLENVINNNNNDEYTRSPEREVLTKVQTKITEISHLKDHLIVEFLDFIKVLKKESKESLENMTMSKNEERDYWKNNFIGLSYSAFSNTREKNETHIPKYLYIYCDIVEKRHVGDSFSPLLRVVRVPPIRMNGDTATVTFDNPHFMNLSKRSFDCIEIYITDEKGKLVSFDKGKVILTLQFQTAA